MTNRNELYLVLDSIRSAHNVGSILRTADAFGVEKVYICGTTATYTHEKLYKTALGAERTVKWSNHIQTWRVLKKLKEAGVNIVALEQGPKSTNLSKFKPVSPMVLIVGNEVSGLKKETLKYAHAIIEIPMHGKKESLNVAVATGIAIYTLLKK